LDAFRTHIGSSSFPFSVDHKSSVVMIGSCFSENIGQHLLDNKLHTTINPFGILFNPFSIMNALERMLNNRPYTLDELSKSGENWVSLDHHGKFNGRDSVEVLHQINIQLETGRKALLEADVVFITLGSAWVYHHLEQDHTVANCHKIPNKEFQKRLLSYQDVHLILKHIPAFFKSKKMPANIVFTVSPVRHWKDGPLENQRSKSILNSAIHEVVDSEERCHYFPSYEYMMDDLRDYRFYAADMLHPNEQAIDYIWDKFQQSFFSDETRIVCKEVKAVVEAANHRPMDPESNSFQRFLLKQLDLINGLETKYPSLDLKEERQRFEGFQL